MPSIEHEQLEDGCIKVKLGDLAGTVSSWHLVPTKENQLREAHLASLGSQKPNESNGDA